MAFLSRVFLRFFPQSLPPEHLFEIGRRLAALRAVGFIDDDGELLGVGRRMEFTTRRNELLSLIPLSRCSGVTTTGLRYGLRSAVLELGVREGTSNRATATRVRVSVRRGTLLLYRLREADSR